MTNESKEDRKKKENQRKSSLMTIKDKSMTSLAAAYLMNQKEFGSGYGEIVQDAIHDYQYIPSLQNPNKPLSELIYGGLISSRANGKRYTGNVSEQYILESSARIVQENFDRVKVSDAVSLLGMKIKLDENISEMYLQDLKNSKNEQAKEIYGQIVGGFLTTMADVKIIESLSMRSKENVNQLEKKLTELAGKK